MQEPILGRDKILMFRKYSETEKAAARLALQVTHEIGKTRESTSVHTKDGAIVVPGGLETVISIEAISSRDAVNLMLEEAVDNADLLEIWEIDFGATPPTEGKYPAKYGRGYLNTWTTPDNVDEHETISTEFTVVGALVKGEATITAEQAEQVAYAFKDVVAGAQETPGV